MNGKDLLNKMSDVDEKLITEAESAKKKKRALYIGVPAAALATAAAVALVLGINNARTIPEPPISGDYTSSSTNSANPADPITPANKDYSHLLPLSAEVTIGAMGSMGSDSGDNVWNGETIDEMPVYRSSRTRPDIEKMRDTIKEVAAALGIPEDQLEIESHDPYDQLEGYTELLKEHGLTEEEIKQELDRILREMAIQAVAAYGKADGIRIQTNTAYMLRVTFEPEIEIPAEYLTADSASEDEIQKTAYYLLDRYKALIDIKAPVVNAESSSAYDSITVYEGNGSLADRIFNNSIKKVEFVFYEGKLIYLDIDLAKDCEKIADYPIITADDAKKLLSEGYYLNIGGLDYNGGEPEQVKLTYRRGPDFVMPFYMFYVEDPDHDYFNWYFVPAVRSEFLGDTPPQLMFNGGTVSANEQTADEKMA